MNTSEKINKIKAILGLTKEEPKVDEIEVKEEVVELAEDSVVEEPKEEPNQEVTASYATMEQLSAVKEELLSLIEAIIEVNKKETKEVPQELSKQEPKEEVELAEEPVEEIVHSPESEVEKKQEVKFSKPFASMTALERVQAMLNNK